MRANGRFNPFYLALLVCLVTTATGLRLCAQSKEDLARYEYRDSSDKSQRKRRLRFDVRPTEKFDLTYNRGFLLANAMPDTAPIRTASSGTHFVGVSLNYIVGSRIMLKAQPGFSIFKVVFDQTAKKTFPGPQLDSLSSEKLRASYLEAPLGVSWLLKYDSTKHKVVTQIEVGVIPGVLIGSSYKLTVTDETGQTVKLKIPDIPDLRPFRFGLYARASYQFVGLWAYYRLTELFEERASDDPAYRYPRFARLELGFSILL